MDESYHQTVAVVQWHHVWTAVWDDPGSNLTAGRWIYHATATTMYSLGHGQHTFTAVLRSTQPSTLSGTVKWVAAFRLTYNNKLRWSIWMVKQLYWLTPMSSRLVWIDCWRLPSAQSASSDKPGELLPCPYHDDSSKAKQRPRRYLGRRPHSPFRAL